jgi:hypothetical protein
MVKMMIISLSLQESSLPDIFTENCWVSPNAVTRSRSNGKSRPEGGLLVSSPETETQDKNHPILSLATSSTEIAISNAADTFSFRELQNEINRESVRTDVAMDEKSIQYSPGSAASSSVHQAGSSSIAVLEPEKISISSIDASLVPSYYGSQRIELHHEGFPFQLHCSGLKVRFGISTKFVDSAGRPRLNFVVDPSPSLCNVLDACDNVARKLSSESGSGSDWRPVVIRKEGFFNYPTIRLQ